MRLIESGLGAAFPKALETADCVPDEIVILDIKEEIPSSSFLSCGDFDALVPFGVPTGDQPKTTRRQKKCSRKSIRISSNASSVSNGARGNDSDAQKKRYNTRSVTARNTLLKSPSVQIPAYESKSLKTKESQTLIRNAMVKSLLETHGKRHLCYICESSFKFSSGLVHHQVQRHGIPRLDLALFRLSRLSVHCAAEFRLHRRNIAGESYRKPAVFSSRGRKPPAVPKSSPASCGNFPTNPERRVRPFCRDSLFGAWCKLVKHAQQRCRSKKPRCGSASALTFRNRCGWCAKTFLRRADLLEHRQQVHTRRKEFSSISSAMREKRVRNDWNCKEKGCRMQLRNKETLRDHMAAAHPTVFLSCPSCRYKTQVEHYLRRHLVRRHKDRYLCPICSKPYHKKFLLKVHMFNQHKIEDPTLQLHRCPHEGCGYACPGKSSLQTHMQKHTVAKPFTCHICGKDFKRALSLDKHINKIHLGIRPYICDKCGTACCDEPDLKRHLLKHEKNKTYPCSICSFSTFHRLVFQSHMLCRHQIIDEKMRLMKCDQCKFMTNKKYRYNDHVKMHKNIRDIPCPECGKPFVTQKTMRQHIVKVHKQTTQSCDLCPFKALTARKLQEHAALMHDLADPGPSRLAAYPAVPTTVSSAVPPTRLDVCAPSYADVGLTLLPTACRSLFPVSVLSGDRCVSDFQEILQPSMNCSLSNIQIPIENGYCQYNPYGANQSMR